MKALYPEQIADIIFVEDNKDIYENSWEHDFECDEDYLEYEKARFRLGLSDRVVYHGGCLGCTSQIHRGLHKCEGCQMYFENSWDNPDYSTEEPVSEIQTLERDELEYRTRKLIEQINELKGDYPWCAVDPSDIFKQQRDIINNQKIKEPKQETLAEYLAALVTPYTRSGHTASKDFIADKIAEGISHYERMNPVNTSSYENFCTIKDSE